MRGVLSNQKGFTLVEIMMVVIIIGILAVLAIPRYQKYTLESKLSEVHVAVGEIKTGMEKYYNSHGNRYPRVVSTDGLSDMELRLRIDLGAQENWIFDIETVTSGTNYYGYHVIAYLTQTGIDRDYNDQELGSKVEYYFPKDVHAAWNDESWKKGWNDDDFFD
jgi:prepilin-type N-terminal cleavage/methylation domain-containing protein